MKATFVITGDLHTGLAKLWANYNGQRGTDRQVERIIHQLNIDDLTNMLRQRGIEVTRG